MAENLFIGPDVATGAWLHIPEKPVTKRENPTLRRVTLPYFVVKDDLHDIIRYTVRTSTRSISGQVVEVVFGNLTTAKHFIHCWILRLPVACNGVVVRRVKDGIAVGPHDHEILHVRRFLV